MAMTMDAYTEGRVKQNISSSTQRTDFGLGAVKTQGNAKSHAECKEDSWEAMDDDVEGCNQEARSRQTPI